jgi:blocked early in transport 1
MDRYGASSLHQRDSRSALFEGYNGPGANQRPVSSSPSRLGGYGYPGGNGATPPPGGFRSATPNSK